MAGDGDGLFGKLFDRYGKQYAAWFLGIITDPAGVVAKTRAAKDDGTLIDYLTPIFVISLLLGATVGALIANRPPIQDRIIILCVVTLLWVFLSLIVHCVCRLLGGKEDALMTLALMSQDLAFVYVASNFLTMLVTRLGSSYEPLGAALSAHLFYSSPGTILFTFQFLFLLALVPLTVSKAHGFVGYRWLVVALFAAVFTVFFGVPVFSMGGC